MQHFFSQEQLRAILTRNALKATGVFAVGLAAIVFLVFQINSKLDTIKEERVKFQTTQIEIERSLAVKSELELLGERDTKLYDTLLSADNILPFINELEESATRHGLTYQDTFSVPVIVDPNPARPLYSIHFSINLSGATDAMLRFAKDLDSLPYFFGPTEMRISSPTAEGQNGPGTFTVQGTLYVTK